MSDIVGGSNFGVHSGSIVGGSNFFGEHHHGDHSDPVSSMKIYAQTFGDGSTLIFPITHNLGTQDTVSNLYDPISNVGIQPSTYTTTHTSPNVTTYTFTTAPAAGAARAVIAGL